jgi:uncharacterized protein
MKFLVWLAFFVLVIAAILTKFSASRIRIVRTNVAKQFDDTGAEIMVSCAHCGIYIPASEAVQSQTGIFCCDEHLNKLAKNP